MSLASAVAKGYISTTTDTEGRTGMPPGDGTLPTASALTDLRTRKCFGVHSSLYADSGPITGFGVGRGTGIGGDVNFLFSISGYLVDVPFTP
jgi:hypothetical protein